MSGDFEATIAECVLYLSKRVLKDLSIYCTFYFFFYLLVKLFTLPELIALVNKDLQYGLYSPWTVAPVSAGVEFRTGTM